MPRLSTLIRNYGDVFQCRSFLAFHTRVIAATVSEAPYVLDGLLHHVHQTDLRIHEHHAEQQVRPITCSVFAACSESNSRRGSGI